MEVEWCLTSLETIEMWQFWELAMMGVIHWLRSWVGKKSFKCLSIRVEKSQNEFFNICYSYILYLCKFTMKTANEWRIPSLILLRKQNFVLKCDIWLNINSIIYPNTYHPNLEICKLNLKILNLYFLKSIWLLVIVCNFMPLCIVSLQVKEFLSFSETCRMKMMTICQLIF